ncbi:MAG TPA: hypothetical protein VFV38_39780 [Ktedonobacteraceae bacterium]|nr:hypothetical protein [Ktedonobacteraceae bacterium]
MTNAILFTEPLKLVLAVHNKYYLAHPITILETLPREDGPLS